nr:unnamed protein product [Callosobruchus analis]
MFWNHMTWSERKVYIQGLVKIETVQRRRGAGRNKQENFSLKYHLKVNNTEIRVCKQMFLKSLGMKESTVKLVRSQEAERRSNDKRGEARRNNYQSRSLKSLSKLELHDCRSSSSKLYLEPIKHYCDENSITPVSKTLFFEEFNKENISIYIPKKDMCDICVAYGTRNIGQEEYDLHQEMKKEARRGENRNRESASAAAVFTMDLEAVLLSPRSTTQDGYCFLWHEAEGGLTASEFSSILCSF